MLTKEFAKVFDTDRGQVVVIMSADDEGCPSLHAYAWPPLLGVCKAVVSYEDSDQGWNESEEAFETLDKDKAMLLVEPLFTFSNGIDKDL